VSIFKSIVHGRGRKEREKIDASWSDGSIGHLPASQDTLAAINELSQLVKNNPDLVEIYLALGNLYRAQGEIERAVQIRTSLILRPGLNRQFKARALYELGRDYKRGGLVDRALHSFEEAATLVGEDEAILREMARLAAESNDFERAARYYGQLRNPTAQAHYMVCLAQKHFAKGDDQVGKKWLAKALKTNPGCVEAWLEQIMRAVEADAPKKAAGFFQQAFLAVPTEMRFVLLEGVLSRAMKLPDAPAQIVPYDKSMSQPPQVQPICDVLLPLLEQDTQELLLSYYGALMLLACGDVEKAGSWIEKTLLISEDFWPARLELLALGLYEQELTPVFESQIKYFVAQARQLERFVCRRCGLKREQVFFVCPRCQSWYSIGFRIALHK
jgi:lipopolysaccharide assembly protein B